MCTLDYPGRRLGVAPPRLAYLPYLVLLEVRAVLTRDSSVFRESDGLTHVPRCVSVMCVLRVAVCV